MRTLASLALAFAATTSFAGWFDDCDYTAARSASLPVAGATSVSIIGRAGELRVTGVRGAAEVMAKGNACTSERDNLQQIQLVATRVGSEVRIEAKVPQSSSFFFAHNALDFEVTLPANLPVRIDDTSGELTVDGVGAAD